MLEGIESCWDGAICDRKEGPALSVEREIVVAVNGEAVDAWLLSRRMRSMMAKGG